MDIGLPSPSPRESIANRVCRPIRNSMSTERSSAPTLAEELASAGAPLVLDVRNPREWAAKHIDGSVNIPLNHLQERIAEIPRDRRIAIHCAGGYRSSIAASILQRHGITNLTEMAGGLAAWEAAKLSVVSAA